MKIIAIRGFMAGGNLHKPGSVVELPDRQCSELIAMNKATRAPSEPHTAAPGPLTTETAAVLVKGTAKETPHAGQ